MTNEQINERIAKLCGWEKSEKGWWTKKDEDYLPEPPQYTSSLDACREFEEAMSAEEYGKYRVHLFTASAGINSDDFEVMKGVSCPSHFSRGRAFHNATPLQRCEAFLRMKGQWVE